MKKKTKELLYIWVKIILFIFNYNLSVKFLAIECNEREIAELLIRKKGFDINAKNKNGRTAFHLGTSRF